MPSMRSFPVFALLCLAASSLWAAPEPAAIIDLWPATMPGEFKANGPEADTSKPGEGLVAGKPLIRLGNVSKPQLHVFPAPKEKANGTAVVICPGGGFHILAWDLEGTEVAEWLNSIGVTAFVLKHRVPTAALQPKWQVPVMDAQRALSIARSRANEWSVDPRRIGILGFSAGGHVAARCSLGFAERQYPAGDDLDKASCKPDFAVLIYGAYSYDDKTGQLGADITVPKDAPPLFFVHAFDDPVSPQNSLLLASAAKKAGVSAEVHLYDAGGHGYGLRPQAQLPVTSWPQRCGEWLNRRGLLSPAKK
jgi:acetyl esterase/lipase